jgi:hypothetical protein
MKPFNALILASMIVSVSIIASLAGAYGEPSVGVRKGDWIEYNVNITGPSPAQSHNITWSRIEILDVEGAAFQANVTVRNVNGTFHSSVWKFNFTEGNLEGWIIIPANLGPGNTFFDASKPGTVTIEGQEQKIVAGASRTVTCACDTVRLVKEWDKATGVYVYSVEHPKNLTVVSQAIATNMWSPQILGLNQTAFYNLAAVSVLLVVSTLSSLIFFAERKRAKRFALHWPSHGKVAALTILTVILVMVGSIAFFPFSKVGLSFAEINLVIQTFWTALVFVSMWFRMKGNYFVHEIMMLVVISAWLVGFSAVILMDPLSGGSLQVFSIPAPRLVMNSLHAIFSIPALVFAGWLVALWRPGSTLFAAKSRKIAQLVTVFWVPAYVVGVVDFMLLHTTFFK